MALLLVSIPIVAAAHPLGNFTINHLARITTGKGVLRLHYVLDIAEIPTFQIMDGASESRWNSHGKRSWTNAELRYVEAHVQLSENGVPLELQALGARSRLRPGAGGLPITRWVGTYTAALRTPSGRIRFDDHVYADRRIGWKDVLAGNEPDPTHDLLHYPSALIGSPRRISAASFTLSPDGRIAGISRVADATPFITYATYWVAPTALSAMFTQKSQSPLFVLLTIFAAFGLGALHAVEPGHGKALLAFTLVGARATKRQAVILAASITVAHTFAVFLLGAALFSIAGFASESVYPWITLISGAVIAFIGARSFAAFVRARRGEAHEHGHAHDQDHDHGGHSHAIPGTAPLQFRSAVWAAMSGGIAPCPAAIVVLLAALRLHQVGYGFVLIVIFSMGLAAVLSGIGLGVVRGAAWLARQSLYERFAPLAPLVTATVISVIGSVLLAEGFVQQGVAAPVPLIAALALFAIAGYALGQRGHIHSHSHLHGEAAAS